MDKDEQPQPPSNFAFCHIAAVIGILRHSWRHTYMHRHRHSSTLGSWLWGAPQQLGQHKVGGARLGAAYLLLPWQVSPHCCLCRGTSPRVPPAAGFLLLLLSLLLFFFLVPFSSVSQRTWALSFSTPEPGVRFYNVDPLQKARSICLIS